ncbi:MULTISPECIES: type VI secretion system baseplate subunit TssF [unclassified Pseudomonas]|uniref:type VI secretion system baseplate subunit TssF n=1 Tax=unclassified Pseudomonas TaxID=196821 RepID=UPI002AC8EA36|nr:MULTISPECIES: type VI secretion system baseplate subunit TssF [unclassified Pseudomonas]MEB0039077.1 type VI secretion system baseplate subunit TssF [Pseudomonas sp. MH10]MEB0079616.1 type VI secretion system baseplate subunit TssF [Pseudomonas sp. MH10out]MEB0092551.1 type VI secretion system baseplate subunit TssF [Pseudomonas sp. CCI4.2]MEB0103822.1 type VI secretion system baseplate subunit TssF [Pseudomonas sp. CCI3.2]MEB0122191.1 type VI secretion system baseplate subunit TssF [Pseudo
MSFNQYYQSELNALRQLGGVFAERNPALAHFLGQGGSDPDVERLLEGFAFLTGRLREKLEDDLPELTHSLMYLLWPNYMRPLPSFSMLQFEPLAQAGPAIIAARDTLVKGKPVEGVSCNFRTCYATEVQALKLADLSYSENGEGALLTLRLEVSGNGHLGDLKLSRLRLHFAGMPYISQTLYLSLLRYLGGVEVHLLGNDVDSLLTQRREDVVLTLPANCIQPVGFAEEESLIPYPLNTFRGYRYLQEYFAFQEKFLFVDISGLNALQSLSEDILKGTTGIELQFSITKNGMERQRPTVDNVKLYCTPIVNLFKHDAVPIRFDAKEDEYLLLPHESSRGHCGVFSVDAVAASEGGGKVNNFVPFESFEHDSSFDGGNASPHYSVRQRPSMAHEGVDTYLSFGTQDIDRFSTVSVDLTCTNQNLPRRLKVGDIANSKETSETLIFRNILVPTSSYAPPLNRDFLWKLISNMSLNYVSLANVNALKVILETYDLPRYYDQKARNVSKTLLDGLKSISHQHVDRLHRGLPVRGLRTELLIDPTSYVGEGDLFLFASILNEFFALYASLNSYHELHVQSTQGEVYQWAPRMGLQPLL